MKTTEMGGLEGLILFKKTILPEAISESLQSLSKYQKHFSKNRSFSESCQQYLQLLQSFFFFKISFKYGFYMPIAYGSKDCEKEKKKIEALRT